VSGSLRSKRNALSRVVGHYNPALRMSRKNRRHGLPSNPGRSPGSLVIPEHALAPRIRATLYDKQRCETREGLTVADVRALKEGDSILWLEIEGYGDEALFHALEERFGAPRLALEDVVNNSSQPKLDLFDGGLFVVAKAVKLGERPELEQVSVLLRGRTVLTFVDQPLDVLTPLRKRLTDPTSLTRRSDVDFLAYRVLDCVVDTYAPFLERLGARLDEVEDEAIARPSSRPLRTLYELMRDVRLALRVALPMRDLVSALRGEGKSFFKSSTLPFLSDLRDHTQGVVELSNHYRDLGTDVRELIHGALNLRMNQVMRLLTAVTSIFIPLSFVTGLYGMNFQHMPELQWRYGYFVVLGVLATIAALVLRWLSRQGWTRVGDE